MTSFCAMLMLLVVMVASGHALPKKFKLTVRTGQRYRWLCVSHRFVWQQCLQDPFAAGTIKVKIFGMWGESQSIVLNATDQNAKSRQGFLSYYDFTIDKDIFMVEALQFEYSPTRWFDWWLLKSASLQHVFESKNGTTVLGPHISFYIDKWLGAWDNKIKAPVVECDGPMLWAEWSECRPKCGQGWRYATGTPLTSTIIRGCPRIKRLPKSERCENQPPCEDEK